MIALLPSLVPLAAAVRVAGTSIPVSPDGVVTFTDVNADDTTAGNGYTFTEPGTNEPVVLRVTFAKR